MLYKEFKAGFLKIVVFKSEFLDVNTYLIFNSKGDAIIIDPSWSVEEVKSFIYNKGLSLKLIVATHCHFDHIIGAPVLKREFNAPIAFDSREYSVLKYNKLISKGLPGGPYYVNLSCDIDLKCLENIVAGGVEMKILHTPGHTPGSVSLYTPDERFLFTGDTLFKDGVGRTDFPLGDFNLLIDSLRRIFESFDEDTIVLPGHGLETTIGREYSENPFVTVYLR